MTTLGTCVDELQVHLLQSSLLGVGKGTLPQSKNPLLRSNTASLEIKCFRTQNQVRLKICLSNHGVYPAIELGVSER